MSSMPWFRMYTDFLNDHKMIALAFEDQRHFIGVLALKSDGALDQDCCPDLLDRIVAQRLWIDHAIIREVKKRLIAAGLIDDCWQPLAWDRRQMRSDVDPTNAERQRRHRARKKQQEEAGQDAENEGAKEAGADGNGSNALHNAPVTGLEEDTDTDKEEDKNNISSAPALNPKLPSAFARFWAAYPNTGRKVAKAKCEQVWKAKKLDLIADEIVSHVEAMKLSQQWVTGYEPAPLTYLNQKRWEDGVPMPGPAASLAPANQSSYAGMNKQEALEARNRAVAQRWAQGGV